MGLKRLPAGVEGTGVQARSWCGQVPHLSFYAVGVAVGGLRVDPPTLEYEPGTHGRFQQVSFVLGARLSVELVP